MKISTSTLPLLKQQLVSGNRAALAKSITLVESTRPDHKKLAQQLLSNVLLHNRSKKQSNANSSGLKFNRPFRIGLSGAPGVGKSSFIENFGMHLLEKGHNLAVLAVDPSSQRTGGSILGDKTRMMELSKHPRAYVRPSPSRGTLGGCARNTNEAIILCESSGFDVVFIETVGVGQSETMVSDMVDMFVLIVAPGAGDELQGIKKGIVELSDLIIVNKADGMLEVPARMTQIEYTSALKFVTPSFHMWRPQIASVSSLEKKGFDNVWKIMSDMYTMLESSNEFDAKRGRQQKKWMWQCISDELLYRLSIDSKAKEMIDDLEEKVFKGEVTPGQAGDIVLDVFIEDQFKKR